MSRQNKVSLPQQVGHRILEHILGIDIHIHQEILIHIAGPAYGHPLEVGQALQHVPQGLGTNGGLDGRAYPDLQFRLHASQILNQGRLGSHITGVLVA